MIYLNSISSIELVNIGSMLLLLYSLSLYVLIQVRDEEEEGGWRTVAEEAPANTDTYSKVEVLVERVRTTAVRVMPVSKHPRMVCLRVELLGCDIDGELYIFCHIFSVIYFLLYIFCHIFSVIYFLSYILCHIFTVIYFLR